MIWISRCFFQLFHEHVKVRFWTNPRIFPRRSFPVYKSPRSHSLNQSKCLRKSCLRKLRLVFQNRGYVSKCRDVSFSQQHYIRPPPPSTVHRTYPDMRYFQNGIHFHGTCANVTSFTVVRKVPQFLLRFSCYSPSRNRDLWGIYCAEFHSKADGKFRKFWNGLTF